MKYLHRPMLEAHRRQIRARAERERRIMVKVTIKQDGTKCVF